MLSTDTGNFGITVGAGNTVFLIKFLDEKLFDILQNNRLLSRFRSFKSANQCPLFFLYAPSGEPHQATVASTTRNGAR